MPAKTALRPSAPGRKAAIYPINFMTCAEALSGEESMLKAAARLRALWRKRTLAEG